MYLLKCSVSLVTAGLIAPEQQKTPFWGAFGLLGGVADEIEFVLHLTCGRKNGVGADFLTSGVEDQIQ